MVVAGKVFRTREHVPLAELARRLKGYRKEAPLGEAEEELLITEIRDLKISGERLEGMLFRDVPLVIRRRGKAATVVRTMEIYFVFFDSERQTFLLVVEKKATANWAANLLSEIIFVSVGGIVEARIMPGLLKRYHDQNSEGTKVVFFDDVDLPNISKLSLYGPSLSNTSLYSEYLSHGNLWYVVITSRKRGIVVGVTRDAVVTVFSKVDLPAFVDYVLDEIVDLIKRSGSREPGV
ncbi:MAG: hypothetical protein QXF24_07450 [Thermoproteota archaeon]